MSTFLKISLLFTTLCVVVTTLGLRDVGPFGSTGPLFDLSVRLGVLGIPSGVVLILTAVSLQRRQKNSKSRQA
jgi:hypothetical protein